MNTRYHSRFLLLLISAISVLPQAAASQWVSIPSNIPSGREIYGLGFVNDSSGYALVSAGGQSPGIYYTSDNCKTWVEQKMFQGLNDCPYGFYKPDDWLCLGQRSRRFVWCNLQNG